MLLNNHLSSFPTRWVQRRYLISCDLHNDLEKWRWDLRLRRVEAETLIPWHPDPAGTPLEFLKKNRLREPGNVGMKDFYKFSNVCCSWQDDVAGTRFALSADTIKKVGEIHATVASGIGHWQHRTVIPGGEWMSWVPRATWLLAWRVFPGCSAKWADPSCLPNWGGTGGSLESYTQPCNTHTPPTPFLRFAKGSSWLFRWVLVNEATTRGLRTVNIPTIRSGKTS